MSKGKPSEDNDFHWPHIDRLLWSYEHFLGRALLDGHGQEEAVLAKQVYHAPFALVSHGMEREPVFNYANQTALTLFAMDWDEFTSMASKFSAEPVSRAERAELLARVNRDNFIDNYRGVRIAKNGRRFMIDRAVVWNVVDRRLNKCGQAAVFAVWRFL